MRGESLSKELIAATQDYNYGIVPGSATVFVKDEMNGIGRVAMTLLEGVMIVVEITDQGFKVVSYTSLSKDSLTLATVDLIEKQIDMPPSESMENMLMSISPKFLGKFHDTIYQKLHNHQKLQQSENQYNDNPSNTSPTNMSYETDVDSWL